MTRTLIVLTPAGTVQVVSILKVMVPLGLLKNCVRFDAITGLGRRNVAKAIALSFVFIPTSFRNTNYHQIVTLPGPPPPP
jgi:hypothetical protein